MKILPIEFQLLCGINCLDFYKSKPTKVMMLWSIAYESSVILGIGTFVVQIFWGIFFL